jgi:hypothetical protein
MDIAYNKTDGVVLPITNTRISASEYNQIAASLMQIITSAGLTPDAADNTQLLTAIGPRVVETYKNGSSWYRIWSDGWCEQGGIVNIDFVQNTERTAIITFLKQFADTDYSIFCFAGNRNYIHLGNIAFGHGGKLTNQMMIVSYTTGQTSTGVATCWEAKGYIS